MISTRMALAVGTACLLAVVAVGCSRDDGAATSSPSGTAAAPSGTAAATPPGTTPPGTTRAAPPGTSVDTAPSAPTTGPPSAPTTGPTTRPSPGAGECPGPDCVDYSISPTSGKAGTAVTVSSVAGACTVTGTAVLRPGDVTAPLTAQGANQYRGTVVIPPGARPGEYTIASQTGPGIPAGCSATFTVIA